MEIHPQASAQSLDNASACTKEFWMRVIMGFGSWSMNLSWPMMLDTHGLYPQGNPADEPAKSLAFRVVLR